MTGFQKGHLAIIAEPKAGKDAAANFITTAVEACGGTTAIINFSDPLGGGLRHGLSHLKRDREHYQRMSRAWRKEFGEDILIRELQFRAAAQDVDLVIFPGMRRKEEFELIRQLPNSHILFLTAPFTQRLQWTRAKNERPGDAEKTEEQFRLDNADEAEIHIREIGPLADSVINNVGTLEDLNRRVRLMLRDRFGYPIRI